MEALVDGFVYVLGPNTDRWVGWLTPEEAEAPERARQLGEDWHDWIASRVAHAERQIKSRTGWRGSDVREGPFVAGLMPAEQGEEFQLAVAFKQDNNGMIYVWSPYAFPWLEESSL